jgi:trehalose 6-phosphate synthase/phosphatase
MTANLNLQVLEGSRVLEVKNAGINKGQASQSWLKNRNWDFILAVGDDWTDETLFEQLPDKAISIKVGYANTQAVYTCHSYRDVRELLNSLMRGIDEKITE